MNSKRNGCFLIASRFINCLGSGIYNICIPLYLLANTHSVLTTSIFFSIIQIPAIVLLPFLGVWLEKKNLKLPQTVTNVIKCKNPRCITSIEQELPHVFKLTDAATRTYRCVYCEEKFSSK